MRSDYWDQPAFETIRPRRLLAPLVYNSAHSGRVYPERFLAMTRLDHLSIRQSEDAWVDELFARAPHLGAPMLRAHFPRAYLDVNCGHCHRPEASASNSGLDLRWEQEDRSLLGVMKRPVAAGRGIPL